MPYATSVREPVQFVHDVKNNADRVGDTTPDYVFSSNEAGTIAVGGNCNSSNTNADNGSNTITFGTTSVRRGAAGSSITSIIGFSV